MTMKTRKIVKSVRFYTHSEEPGKQVMAVTLELRFTKGRMAEEVEACGLPPEAMKVIDREATKKSVRTPEGKDCDDTQDLLSEFQDVLETRGVRQPYTRPDRAP